METKTLNALDDRIAKWHYEGGSRDLRLDLLRGFAALAMIADHVGGDRSLLYPLTGNNRFVVSAAEAFVFISGVVVGIVYARTFIRQGLASALMKALHRASTLYLVTVFLTLSSAALAALLGLWWAPDVNNGGISRFVLDVVLLHRTIFLVDVLLLYVFLLLAAGVVILLLSQHKTVLVLAISWLIWAAWQVSPESSLLPWQIQDNTTFNLAAWQVLFVNGLAIGWHRQKVDAWLHHLHRPVVFGLLASTCLIIVGLYMVQVTEIETLERSKTLYDVAFDKPNLPIGRLLVFVPLAAFSYAATTLFWDPIRRWAGWLLLTLGRNALLAYALHVFVVALTTKLLVDVIPDSWPHDLVSTGLAIVGVLTVWLIVSSEPWAHAWLGRTVSKMKTPKSRDGVQSAHA